MTAEIALANGPQDVSVQKVGYDIASYDPNSGHMRFIEVGGRIDTVDTVMITRQKLITSRNEPEKFNLAIVQVGQGFFHEPRYVCGSPDRREPPLEQNVIQFNIKRLLERAEDLV